MNTIKKSFVLTGLSVIYAVGLSAQSQTDRAKEVQLNTITTAVPFLLIGPDSRSGGMGDGGVAISPDANSINWNASKLAFVKDEMEFSMSYSPWLRNLVPDINLAYLSGYKRIDKQSTIGVALRYFSLGKISFTDQNGSVIRDYVPNEFSLDVAYARKLSDRFSVSMTGRFIYSNLTGGVIVSGANTKAGKSGAVDVAGFYTNDDIDLGGMKSIFSFGFNISNIGAKMNYTNSSGRRDFLPMNLRIGTALTLLPDDYNKVTFNVDFNKLLVPSPPIYQTSPNGSVVYDANGNPVILSGKDPNVGIATAIFQSFSDAPGYIQKDGSGNTVYDASGKPVIEKGSRFKEEIREINFAPGVEWWYADQFAVRGGYFHEATSKGNRKYFTVGAGIRYSVFSLDLSYLVSLSNQNPLNKTLRFTLKFTFEKLKKAQAEPAG